MASSIGTRIAASLALLLGSISAPAAAVEPRLSLTDDTVRNELLLVAGPIPGHGDITIEAPRALLVYRFVLRVVAREGAAESRGHSTVVVYREDGAGVRSDMATLSSDIPEWVLPRPLSFELRAGDRIGLRALIADGDAAHLVVTIEYETPNARVSRLPVLPLTGVAAQRVNGVTEWIIEAPADGRLLALSGLPGSRGEVLVLDEAGAIVFRCAGAPTEAFAGSAAVVRVGIGLRAGERYRVVVEGEASGVLALLLTGGQRLAAR